MASKKPAPKWDIDELFKKHLNAHIEAIVNQPNPLLDDFYGAEPGKVYPGQIPMKQMYGVIKLEPGEFTPALAKPSNMLPTSVGWSPSFIYSKAQDPNSFAGTEATHWPCGCFDGQESYGKTKFKCANTGNHCYRERAGG